MEDLINIEWRRVYIDGMETVYEVSEYGNVRNTEKGNILKPHKMKSRGDRERVLIYVNGTRYDRKTYRLVYEAFHGPIPDDLTIDNIDENKFNNHYSNLRLLTASENIQSFRDNNPDFLAKYPSEQIHEFFKLCKKGKYYKDAAREFGLTPKYARDLLRGDRRRRIWELYQPFDPSIYRRSYFTESDKNVIIKGIIDGLSTREILDQLEVNYESRALDGVYKLRKKLGIKDPKFFDLNFLNDISLLIINGKTNSEIYDIMHLECDTRISDMMARRRKLLNIPNNNFSKGNKEETELVRKLIKDGFSNDEILKKIGKERNQYYVNLFGKERKKLKKQINSSSTIDQL